jgi:hypothetical protein
MPGAGGAKSERSSGPGDGRARIFRRVAAFAAIAATLAGCSLSNCAYYGDPDYHVRCVITGPSPTGGNN